MKLKKYLLSPGIEPTISIFRDSHIYHSSTLAQVIVGIGCIYVWTTTALKDWLYFPTIKIRPVVHEKQLSGSQIWISIVITPNFELGLPMINTSLLTKFHQNPTSSLWEILLTNKQTDKQTKKWHSESADPAKALDLPLAKQTNKQKNKKFCPHRGSNSRPSRFQHNALTDWVIGPSSTDYYYQITIIRLLLSD